jgi:hypothetical protein
MRQQPMHRRQTRRLPVLGSLPRNETLIAGMLTGRAGTPGNFNEWVGWKNRDRGMQNLANEPLWSVDFATGEIINGLATGDPVYNEDFSALTIPLREGVTWDDGTPFTSADVVFTVETLMAHEGFNAHTFFVENVASVTAPDDLTVAFELNAPNSRFHTTFLDRWGATWIMPKHIFEGVDDPVTFEFNPFVGTGPYKLHSFDEAGFWTVWEKRADWQNSPTGILYGEPVPQVHRLPGLRQRRGQGCGPANPPARRRLTCRRRVSRRRWPRATPAAPTSAAGPGWSTTIRRMTGITFNTAKVAPYDDKRHSLGAAAVDRHRRVPRPGG